MKKNLKYVYYRHPRTHAEARANQEGWERPRRRPKHLPDTYDDLYPPHEKTWKNKRKTQYYPGGRGKENSIIVDAEFTYEWELSKYFDKHDIPYRIEPICESRMREFPKWRKVYQGLQPVYTYLVHKKNGKAIYDKRFKNYTNSYTWVKSGSVWRHVVYTVAYRIIWWYDKDIGIDYILSQCRRRRQYTTY